MCLFVVTMSTNQHPVFVAWNYSIPGYPRRRISTKLFVAETALRETPRCQCVLLGNSGGMFRCDDQLWWPHGSSVSVGVFRKLCAASNDVAVSCSKAAPFWGDSVSSARLDTDESLVL